MVPSKYFTFNRELLQPMIFTLIEYRSLHNINCLIKYERNLKKFAELSGYDLWDKKLSWAGIAVLLKVLIGQIMRTKCTQEKFEKGLMWYSNELQGDLMEIEQIEQFFQMKAGLENDFSQKQQNIVCYETNSIALIIRVVNLIWPQPALQLVPQSG